VRRAAQRPVDAVVQPSLRRVLRAQRQMPHRGRAKAPRKGRPPTTHVATAPRQLWCWDMTFLARNIAGHWLFLYLIVDVYSRKVVGFQVHEDDDSNSDHAGSQPCCLAAQV
jgi:putative transposase